MTAKSISLNIKNGYADDIISHMEIKYLADKALLIKGKKEVVLVDSGKEDLKQAGRILIYTSDGFDSRELEDDKRVIIRGPGEYEIGGVEIVGYRGGGVGKTVYEIVVDGVTMVVMGEMEEALSDKKIEKIAGADIMTVSIGGKNKLAYKSMIDLAKKWGVNYLVPINYSDEDLKKFLDEADSEGSEAAESLKADKDSLPDGLEVVVLKNGRSA